MSNWSEGYVTDIGYTYGYYQELNPVRMKLALAESGWAAPKVGTACELGFGQGISINIHAAGSDVAWYGTDFNPSQVNFARDLGEGTGARVHLFDEAFSEFARRDDLPGFDFIGLHGIWSWVDDKNRAFIVDFLQRKLNVGGVLYLSYNTLAGCAPMLPIRELLRAHSEILGSSGQGTVARVDQALDFVEKLLKTNPIYARLYPDFAKRLDQLKKQDRHYLAHEYFNKHWVPMSFKQTSDWLEPAKLTYAGSAHFPDLVDAINLTQPQQEMLAEIPDPLLKQLARDTMVAQQFRRDYWIKGPRRLTAVERLEVLRNQRVLLTTVRQAIGLKFAGALGEASFQEAVYNPILDVLGDHRPKTLGEIERALAPGINFAQIRQAILLLTGAGHLQLLQDESAGPGVTEQAHRLNQVIRGKVRAGEGINYLASPLTGGGVNVGGLLQLFLLAHAEGKQSPQEWVDHAWAVLSAQGQVLSKDGAPLKTEQENKAHLAAQAQLVYDKQLPILKALDLI